jgi:hypothetical protein
MDKANERLSDFTASAIGDLQRVTFNVVATKKQHERLHGRLLSEPGIQALLNFRDPEED